MKTMAIFLLVAGSLVTGASTVKAEDVFADYPRTIAEIEQAGGKPITAAEIVVLVSGHVLVERRFMGKYQNTLKQHAFQDNGTFSTTNVGEKRGSDSGTWRVDGDRLCQVYANWGDGKEECKPLYQWAKGYAFTGSTGSSNGEVRPIVEIR